MTVGLLPNIPRPYCTTDGRVVLVHDIVNESHSGLSKALCNSVTTTI